MISDSWLDGKQMRLEAALDETVGFVDGTIISCIPGRLAFFEGEENGARYILERAQSDAP